MNFEKEKNIFFFTNTDERRNILASHTEATIKQGGKCLKKCKILEQNTKDENKQMNGLKKKQNKGNSHVKKYSCLF